MSRRNDASQDRPEEPRRRGALATFARGVLWFVACFSLGVGATLFFLHKRDPQSLRSLEALARVPLARKAERLEASIFPSGSARMERPFGMAPVAFDGFIRACLKAGVHPNRIGQTIGDHPLSVGYHKRDGTLDMEGRKIDYCAAVDLGSVDLTPAQVSRFCIALAGQGFASFHRNGPKWKGGEHIHAIYALIPMKPQLRFQVREWLQARRDNGFGRLKWERKLRLMRQRHDDVP